MSCGFFDWAGLFFSFLFSFLWGTLGVRGQWGGGAGFFSPFFNRLVSHFVAGYSEFSQMEPLVLTNCSRYNFSFLFLLSERTGGNF